MKNLTPTPGINYNLGFRSSRRHAVVVTFEEPSRTKQSFKDEVDINNIVNKFQNGVLPVTNNLEPQYGDSPTSDLKESLDLVFQARAEFNNLSNDEKSLFDYDENSYFDFLENPQEFANEIVQNFDSSSSKDLDDSPSEEPSET